MATARSTINRVKSRVGGTVDNAWVERLVQLGYGMRGVLYIVIGAIAVQVAIGTRSAPADTNGALQEIGKQPFGQFLLALMAIGLTGYALWGFIRAIWDPLNKGHDARGLVQRLGFLWSGLSYGLLVLPIVGSLQGQATVTGGRQTAQTQDLTARLLHAPFGTWMVVGVGLIVIGSGIGQFYYAYKREFRQDLRLNQVSGDHRKWIERMGEWGYAARGVVFTLIGLLLVEAALTFNPQKAQGLDGALLKLGQQPYGTVLLGIVALGLVCFGVFSIISAQLAKV